MLAGTAACGTTATEPSAAPEVSAEASKTPSGTSAETKGQPMDASVMKPWINSDVIGMVTEDVNAEAKG